MKPKTLILMAVAIVCGLVASYMTSRLIAEQKTVLAVVAKKDFGAGTLLKHPEEMFEPREILVVELPRGFIPAKRTEYLGAARTSIGEVRNRVLVRDLNEGDVLTSSDLLSEEQARLLLLEGVPGMIERFEELEKQDILPVEYRQRVVALAEQTDLLHRQHNLLVWVLAVIFLSGVTLFVNFMRTTHLGVFERHNPFLKWSALTQGVAFAVLLGIAAFNPPRETVGDATLAAIYAILFVFLAILTLRLVEEIRRRRLRVAPAFAPWPNTEPPPAPSRLALIHEALWQGEFVKLAELLLWPKPKTLILMLVAIICGLAASYVTSTILGSQTEIVMVAVAKGDFGAGTLLRQPENMFEPREVRRPRVPRRFIPPTPTEDLRAASTSIADMRNRVLVRSLNEGEVLTDHHLLSAEQEERLEDASGMLERFENLEKQHILPADCRQRVVALVEQTDLREADLNLFRWVLVLFLISGMTLFVNLVRTTQLGIFERYQPLLKWSALTQGIAFAVLLGIAAFQPPRESVGDAVVAGVCVIAAVFVAIDALKFLEERRARRLSVAAIPGPRSET